MQSPQIHVMIDDRKHWALRPHKPLRLIRDGEVGGGGGQNCYIEHLLVTPSPPE